jgi:hypothetical protein
MFPGDRSGFSSGIICQSSLFLVDSLWFLGLAGYLVMEFVNGRSKGWLMLVILSLWMVETGLKYPARFRGTSIARLHA